MVTTTLSATIAARVAVSGPNLAETTAYVEEVRKRLAEVPSLRDVQIAQPLNYPTVAVKLPIADATKNETSTFQNQGDAPSCSDCGSLMVRSG